MDNLLLFAIAGIFGVMFVTIGNLKKQLQQRDLDSRLDDIYRDLGHIRDDINKEVELLNNQISKNREDMFREIGLNRNEIEQDYTERFQSISYAHNELERRFDEVEDREPTLFDNAK